MDPAELHRRVEQAFNAGDVDALVALYEPDARMVRDDQGVARGVEEIRAVWAGFVALGGRIELITRYAVESGDIALLSNTWTFDGGDGSFSSTTAEVARRQPNGTWLYTIDNPFGGLSDTT